MPSFMQEGPFQQFSEKIQGGRPLTFSVARYGIFGTESGSIRSIMICEVWCTLKDAEEVKYDLKKAGYRKLKVKRLGDL